VVVRLEQIKIVVMSPFGDELLSGGIVTSPVLPCTFEINRVGLPIGPPFFTVHGSR
jgi:hypothetical protein